MNDPKTIANKFYTGIAKKFDEVIAALQKNPIRIDLGDATKRMEETAEASTKLLEAMQTFLRDEKFSREQTLEIISAVQDAVRSQSHALASQDSRASLDKICKELSAQTEVIKSSKTTIDYAEQKKTNKLLADAVKAISEIAIPEVIFDTQKQETLLSNILVALDKNSKALAQFTADIKDAIKSISFEVPETFKLDEMQLRSMRSGNMATNPNPLAARSSTVANVSMTTANTQYSYKFPNNTVSWELRIRDTDVPLLVAYTTGKLPTSGDGSAYFTVPAYYISTNSGVDWGGQTIYLQTGSASQVCEIISYQA